MRYENADLNGFLLETTGDIPNATTYDQQLLAATYVVEDDQTHIIHFVEAMYLMNKQAGCRFLTVDAIPSAVDFYKKCKFFTLKEPVPVPEGSDADELDQTTLMGFDLKSF